MAIKNIRTYTPGKNDFLHFAETMNKNYAIDLKKVAPNGEPLQAPEALGGNVGGVNPIQETNVGEVPPANAEQGAVTGTTDTGTVDTNIDTTTDTTVTPTTVPTTDAYSGGISWDDYKKNNGVLEEKDWYAAQGLDPDADYQNTVNALNYAYQTSMATYGENAENLYQMGLQNSGVSDIFQANAFSSYLANMNNAANARIAANKQNKALYGAYVAQKQGDYNTYVQNWQTTVNDAVTAIKQSGVLTSENTDEEIRAALEAYGVTNVSNELVAQVKTKLKNIEDLEGSVNKNFATERIETIDQDLIEATNNGERPNTYAEYVDADTALDGLEAEGYDKATIDEKKEIYRKARVDLITNVSKGTNKDIDNAYKTLGQEFLGVSEEDWKNMSDGDQRHLIVEKAGELVGTRGGLTREEYGQIVTDWVDIETRSMIKANNESKDNNAFIRAGALAFKLDEFYEDGYLTEEQYKDELNRIISNIGFGHRPDDRKAVIGWSETVREKDSSWLGVQINPDYNNNKMSSDIANMLNEKLAESDGKGLLTVPNNSSTRGDYALVVLDGKLYAWENSGTEWVRIDYQDFSVYDSDWYYRTPSDNQKYGMYQLLVTMLENKETNDAAKKAQADKEESANQYQQDIKDKYDKIYSDLQKEQDGE